MCVKYVARSFFSRLWTLYEPTLKIILLKLDINILLSKSQIFLIFSEPLFQVRIEYITKLAGFE